MPKADKSTLFPHTRPKLGIQAVEPLYSSPSHVCCVGMVDYEKGLRRAPFIVLEVGSRQILYGNHIFSRWRWVEGMPYQNAPSQDADQVQPNLGFGRPQAALPSSPSSWMLTCGAVAKILGCIFLGASICSDLWALNVTVGISYAQ
jgi:hypothetical protein